jgi:hypothetical protein
LWVRDQRHGDGTEYYPNGTQYSGNFEHGLRQGYGELTYEDGAKYKGGWKDNRQHGKGVNLHPEGTLAESLPPAVDFEYTGILL